MASMDSSEVIVCSNCGAEVGSRSTCPSCGMLISPQSEGADQIGRDETLKLIESTNQNLESSGTRAAESAFGLGCFLGGLIGLVLLVSVFILGIRNWILLGILGMVLVIIALGAAVGISTRAKSATMDQTYERSTKRDIEQFLLVNRLSRREFDQLAHQVLPKEAPLRKYLRSADVLEIGSAEE